MIRRWLIITVSLALLLLVASVEYYFQVDPLIVLVPNMAMAWGAGVFCMGAILR